MEHNKVVKDIYRGTVRINVRLSGVDTVYYWKNDFRYDITVWQTLPKKRKEVQNYSAATKEEIIAAKLELWEKIKPCL